MRFHLLLPLLLYSLFSFAQENNLIKRIDWSKKHNISEDFRLMDVIHHKEGIYTVREGIYSVREGKKGTPLFIGSYNRTMDAKTEVGFDPTARGINWSYEGTFWMNNQFHLFSSFYDNKASKNILYRQSIDKERDNLQLGVLKEVTNFTVKNKHDLGEFELLKSASGNLLLSCSKIPNRSDNIVLQLRLFDQQFDEKEHKNIVLPFTQEQMEVMEKHIDEAGNFYILGRIYQKGRVDRRNGTPNYEYVLVIYKNQATQALTYHLNVDDYLLTDLKFNVLKNNEVILAGLISDAGNAKTNGICYFKVDLQNTALQIKKKSLFQTQPISLAAAQTTSSEEIKIPRYLKIDHLFSRSDGGSLMIAERSFQVSKYTYQDDDILVVNINPDGTIDWVSQIPKKQSSYYTEDVILSYFPFIVEDKIYLIYNDDGRNFSYTKNRKRVQRHKTLKGYAALTEIQRDGTWRTYPLSDNSIEDLVIHPQSCKQIGRKTILIYEAFRNTYRFGKLELK
ncbi:MAG: hypothetical protein AAF806_08580 [Bacteroidota bacterium]